MFRKRYDWIDEYIKKNENNESGGAFRHLKRELETKENTIQKLRYELRKYKAPVKKSRV